MEKEEKKVEETRPHCPRCEMTMHQMKSHLGYICMRCGHIKWTDGSKEVKR